MIVALLAAGKRVRLNVAIRRAKTLAIVLTNPKLLELDAKSVGRLRLADALAWMAEEGST